MTDRLDRALVLLERIAVALEAIAAREQKPAKPAGAKPTRNTARYRRWQHRMDSARAAHAAAMVWAR